MMNVQRWIHKQQKIWEELEKILSEITHHGFTNVSKLQIQRMGSLYKLVAGDLSRAKNHSVSKNIRDYLNTLVSKAHNQVYISQPLSLKDFIIFFTKTFPQTFRNNLMVILIAFVIFTLGASVAMNYVHFYTAETQGFFVDEITIAHIKRGILWTDKADHGSVASSFITTNNIKVAFLAFSYGLIFGLGSLYILWINGFSIGGTLQVVIEYGLGQKLLTFMAAHGVIELTTIFISAGAGFIIGWALISPGRYKRWDAVKMKIKEAGYLVFGCIPLLIIAGMIEGFISLNHQLPDMVKYTVSTLSAVVLYFYLFFSGKERHPEA